MVHNGNIKYEDWCIEDILNVSNVKYQDSNIDTDNDIESLGELDDQYENNEVESNEENECIYDRPDNINNGNESENTIQNTEISKRGRPKSLTLAESLKRKEEYLREREDRLRLEGVRRSTRLANIHEAKLVENIQIPHNFDEARNSSNWKNAMEDELASLNSHDV